MNAFHPDFMKTFYPNFWTEQILASRSSQAMTAFNLKKREFVVFTRAGMPK
jgi:hypothetical protein